MKTLGLLDLQPGMTINVRSLHREGAAPMVRTLTSAKRVKERGAEWFYWRWTPGQPPKGDSFDCGYSGVQLDAIDIAEYTFEAQS